MCPIRSANQHNRFIQRLPISYHGQSPGLCWFLGVYLHGVARHLPPSQQSVSPRCKDIRILKMGNKLEEPRSLRNLAPLDPTPDAGSSSGNRIGSTNRPLQPKAGKAVHPCEPCRRRKVKVLLINNKNPSSDRYLVLIEPSCPPVQWRSTSLQRMQDAGDGVHICRSRHGAGTEEKTDRNPTATYRTRGTVCHATDTSRAGIL